MKIEIEVTEAQIKDAIERHIRVAIANMNAGYCADESIRDKCKKFWNDTADKIIQETIGDDKKLKKMIEERVASEVDKRVNKVLKSI